MNLIICRIRAAFQIAFENLKLNGMPLEAEGRSCTLATELQFAQHMVMLETVTAKPSENRKRGRFEQ